MHPTAAEEEEEQAHGTPDVLLPSGATSRGRSRAEIRRGMPLAVPVEVVGAEKPHVRQRRDDGASRSLFLPLQALHGNPAAEFHLVPAAERPSRSREAVVLVVRRKLRPSAERKFPGAEQLRKLQFDWCASFSFLRIVRGGDRP